METDYGSIPGFTEYFGEFFGIMKDGRTADVISASSFLTESIVPQKSGCGSAEEFLRGLLFGLCAGIPLCGYCSEYMAFSAVKKTGFFSYARRTTAESLATVIQNTPVPAGSEEAAERIGRAVFAYLNSSYSL